MTDKTGSDNSNQASRQQQGSGSQQRSAGQQGSSLQQGSRLPVTQQRQPNALAQRSGGMPVRRMPSGTQVIWNGSPFALVRSMVRDMDRFVDDVWFNRPMPAAEAGLDLLDQQGLGMWLPEIELNRKDGNVMISADLPGMNRDDINLEVRDGNLVISGERQQVNEQDRQGFYRSERRYGSFERVIPLPEGADAAHATARFNDGVLEVTVPVPQVTVGGQKIKVE